MSTPPPKTASLLTVLFLKGLRKARLALVFLKKKILSLAPTSKSSLTPLGTSRTRSKGWVRVYRLSAAGPRLFWAQAWGAHP